jgi:putative ABC transport system substrate-binding protein
VVYYGGDPVKDGFVASLSRPGGNLTGLTGMDSELGSKRLALLHEMVPQADTIGFLTERGGDNTAVVEHQNVIRGAARSLGLELVEFEVVGPVLARAFDTFVERQARAVLVDNVATLFAATRAIVRLEQQYKIPTMHPNVAGPRVGGLICDTVRLMSYQSADIPGIFRQAASQYVARILKGAKPAELPVQQPTRFELLINLKTAKALGLTVPRTLLALADEVIE